MAWFKTDDTWHSHPKPRRAGLEAIGLWSVSGSYSMAYKTDGWVPEWFAHDFPRGRKLADQLVSVGLWCNEIRNGEPGYQFHDWLDYQQSSEEIERDRERARERQKKFRDQLRNRKAKEGDNGERNA